MNAKNGPGELAPFHGILRSVSTVERVDESRRVDSLFPIRFVRSPLSREHCFRDWTTVDVIRFLVGKMRNDYCEEGDISGDLNERPVSFFLFFFFQMETYVSLYDIV